MKLNKLTSAVSVSLLAVALTACGSDDDAPIINTPTTTTPAPTTNTGTTTTTPADNSANIAALTAAFKAAGLADDKAAALANANPTVVAGSPEFTALVNAAQPNTNTGVKDAVSPTVEKQNPFINKVDTTKVATVTANQYTRQDGSTFDQIANPSASGALGAIGVDDPTEKNPYLSNYVLGVEVVAGKVIATDSTGELVKQTGSGTNAVAKKVPAKDSPYAKNDSMFYVTDSLDASRSHFYGDGFDLPSTDKIKYKQLVKHAGAPDADGTPISKIEVSDDALGNKIATIQEINQNFTKVSNEVAAAAEAVAKGQSAPSGSYEPNHSGLIVYTASSDLVGNSIGSKQGIKAPSFGVEENIYQHNKDGKLVAVNTPADLATADAKHKANEFVHEAVAASGNTALATSTEKLATADDKTALTANNFATRVFGKNYIDYEAGASGQQKTDNSYIGRYNSAENLVRVATTKLQNVQYGRLTNNIDVLDTSSANKSNAIIYRQFQQHGAPNTVDTYFYRGTNHTTVANMEELKAKGGTFQYYGHALTYGIGPKVPAAAVSTTLPTAYGLTSTEATIGNFVEAKFDAASSTVTGNVYNFINPNTSDSNSKFTKQDLVSFKGDVYGNTATGTATKLGVNEVGTFTGSFFGKDAQELGGSITSISRDVGYTTPKWGAVFGATKGSSVGNFNVIEQGNP